MNTLLDIFKEHMKSNYKTVKVNGSEQKAFFKEIEDKASEDTKYMFIGLGNCKQGDIVEYDGYCWLAVSQGISFNAVYEKVVIKKCQYNVNFIIKGILKSIPSTFESKVMDVTSGQYISLPTGTILLTIPVTDFTKTIDINDRFINTGRAWKVTGIDRTKDNLIILTCSLDSVAADDDLANEIANKSSYTLNIINTVVEVNEGESLQIIAEFKQGDTALKTVSFSYFVDDTSIATISDAGVLSGIKEGAVNVIVKINENSYYTVTKTFLIKKKNLVPVYTVTPSDREILQGDKIIFTCNKYVDGILTATTWNIQNITGTSVPSSYYQFAITSANTFSIQNLNQYTSGQVKIRCIDTKNTDSSNNYIDVYITLSAAW
ncbi:Ig-like domain-containing protein [Clostridium sp. BNL1100]|uniref:Ig-like domain-containing protein n=1 Tax=Clostridium sp. BNL1100 TaxID=755731 RepID=UPI00024A7758|nr:Ig-like domain-containing protein [Clostridium sp. BNL1100]AEY67831.1 Ig-like domain-containing protein [Clostridium sp. BNL1100]